ncbi:citrate synthase [Halalkalibacter hemicellulosilyticusJCM 9152]|uniref:Citrate synthase n=1 Tax=Halalkalibacter hemicellulosilyticusJCM 9152 TaxID=1236971 RepID=W4QEM1_9BACI|nr:citrate synthase [Halalkalibacter hemicellulosilyticusJCM 9152]
MNMLKEIEKVENVEPYIRKALDNKEKIMALAIVYTKMVIHVLNI